MKMDDDDDPEETEDEKKDVPVVMKIQERFLDERRVFLWGAVNERTAKDIVEKLVYLDLVDRGKPITFYMNTPGGHTTSGMAIYDTIKLLSSPVTVVVTGMAASMGSILLCAPKKGRRLLYPHAQVMIHQPLISGQIYAPAVDIDIHAKEMERIREEMNRILASASGQPLEKVRKDTDRDFYLTAEQAIEYGLADKIVDKV
ncbi:MAG: ATP-dependent Clp protease proteolytic subunit [Puniceicoccales bacterium]|jgi:ATP-dependent Clp protease protease subunit|nr:ATP-dependent Clp protease proteolytic subunit [Puniceicoccales bacterium]